MDMQAVYSALQFVELRCVTDNNQLPTHHASTQQANNRSLPKLCGHCPINPQCNSHGRYFQNIQKHIVQKQECLDFMQSLH